MCVCVCVRACVRVVRACVRVVHACVRVVRVCMWVGVWVCFMQDKIIASHTCFGGHMDVNC